jgi:hypothetical protein
LVSLAVTPEVQSIVSSNATSRREVNPRNYKETRPSLKYFNQEARYETKQKKVSLHNIMFRDNSLQEIDLASENNLDFDDQDDDSEA